MTQTQQPEALNLEEFRAKVTRAAREPLLARIAELEAVLSAMGEKGNPVEPADIPRATDQDTHFFLAGWNGRAAQVDPHEHFRNAAATAPAYPAVGMPEQTSRDAVIQHLTSAGVLEHDGCGIFIASGDASELIDACMAISATHPTQQGLDKVTLLSKDHTGMKVDYSGLLGQVRREIKRSAPGLAEMIRQLQEHMQELGQRWYAGDTAVVDELLQLYSVERQARDAIAAQAKQGEQANG